MQTVPFRQAGMLTPLFRDSEETMVWSFLQGHMGSGAADHLPNPTTGRIVVGDFCFFAGDAAGPCASELVSGLWDDTPNPSSLLISPDEKWQRLIERVYPGHFTRFLRYALAKTAAGLDRRVLRAYASAPLPPDFRLVRMDAVLYREMRKNEWLQDLCSQFPTWNHYCRQGRGFVLLYRDRPVCGASSYTVYDGGIEIEIDTLPGFRRRGFATVCGAALMLDCLENGLYPSWDAANTRSLALAKKLGYRPAEPYVTYLVTKPE